ncbi:MAG: 2-oxo acid dehydrogenase subunit E2 [Candidatus Sericytochromatia bacterium]|nr:2-oxo acid dehydrogenase subunit E2 [Candidatus Sericytochromatia bacterium]
MASDVIMPKMGYDMTSGVLARWLKHPGDRVRSGEPIAEVETDKVTIEIESFASGTVDKLLANEGDRVPVGTPIATITTDAALPDRTAPMPIGAGEGGEAIPVKEAAGAGSAVVTHAKTGPETTPGREGREPRSQAGGPMPASMAEAEVAPPTGREDRIKVSPLARRLAQERGISLSGITGSGPGGRIIKADVEAAEVTKSPETRRQAAPPHMPTTQPVPGPMLPPMPPADAAASPVPQPSAPTVHGEPEPSAPGQESRPPVPAPEPQPPDPVATSQTAIPMSRSQRAVARLMAISKQTIPHFYVTVPITMDHALTLRADMNDVLPPDSAISINDLVIKAVALALSETPDLCRRWTDAGFEPVSGIHVAIAVATPEGGIISPVLRNADRTPLPTLARRARQLIQAARKGHLSADAMRDAVFTVSNLGASGVESFTAIITPPESAVLAVASIQAGPVVRDSDIDIEQRMRVTLSADHRLIGGVAGAAFLHRVRARLESPYRLLVDVTEDAA